MGWKPVEVDFEFTLRRHSYETDKDFKARVKDAEKEHAAKEVNRFERYLDAVSSFHQECSPLWNWAHIANSLPPVAPVPTNAAESAAQQAIANYQPGFLSRLSGSAAEQRLKHEQALVEGRRQDAELNASALHRYQLAHRFWAEGVRVAPGVLRRDLELCRAALVHGGGCLELEKLGTNVELDAVHDGLVVLRGTVNDDEVVPHEEAKLTASGKLSIKAMTESRWWALMQTHVCSAALRIAQESYFVLGADVAVVNMFVVRMDPSIGYRRPVPVLGGRFDKVRFQGINLRQIDPAAAMKNFPHRIKFKKSSGFDPIEPMAHDEQWVST